MNRYILLITLLFANMTPCFAWTNKWGSPTVEKQCLLYDARYSEAPLFHIVIPNKNAHAFLYSSKVACSTQPDLCKSAKTNQYLVDGNVVFAGPEDKGYRCVYYGNKSGKLFAGFVKSTYLKPYLENKPLTQMFLAGTWSYEGNPKITFTPVASDKVKAVGNAFYQGLNGSLNTGQFSAVAKINGKEIRFSDSGCVVDIIRRGPYLVSSDNGQCGGANVSFSSILMKIK